MQNAVGIQNSLKTGIVWGKKKNKQTKINKPKQQQKTQKQNQKPNKQTKSKAVLYPAMS